MPEVYNKKNRKIEDKEQQRDMMGKKQKRDKKKESKKRYLERKKGGDAKTNARVIENSCESFMFMLSPYKPVVEQTFFGVDIKSVIF